MNFDQRFQILRGCGRLSDDNEALAREMLAYLNEAFDLALTEEWGGMLVTHLCAALERISRGEAVAPIDEEVYAACREEPAFPRAQAIAGALRVQFPVLPAEELRYLTLHLGNLLSEE